MIKLPLYCSRGSIIILSGPVQAGKTTALINMLNEHRNQTLYVKHNTEKRYHPLKIVTHNGKEIDCKVLSSIEEIKSLLTVKIKIIAIDDSHFFGSSLIKTCLELREEGKIILLTIVDRDHTGTNYFNTNFLKLFGNPIKSYLDLEKEADIIIHLAANCSVCGQLAHRYKRIISGILGNDDPYIMIGGSDLYKPLCEKHFYEVCKTGLLPK